MMQYLVILLDDTSVAYCHADNPLRKRHLIPLDTLKAGILYGMKQNLMIQFVYPDYELPEEYFPVIESIDHVKIYPYGHRPFWGEGDSQDVDVEVSDTVPLNSDSKNLLLRLSFSSVLQNKDQIAKLFSIRRRLIICITDIESFSDCRIDDYQQLLSEWINCLLDSFTNAPIPQINLLTDRLYLTAMRNCDAGVCSITLAPNGHFYLCPAFYYDGAQDVGGLDTGIQIPNGQLLKLDHAPLCRECDAYHCKRCIWLNSKLTWDMNTPSHQQCVTAHIERNACRQLLAKIREKQQFMSNITIEEIDYLDPFEVKREY